MKLALRTLIFGLLFPLYLAAPAAAQYMKITTDNPTDNTRLRATGTTILTITLDTTHDRDGSLQTCNSHVIANCGAPPSSNPLRMFSYQVYLRAIGGTVTWGSFTPDSAAYTLLMPQIQDARDVQFTYSRPPGTSSPLGFNSLGKIPVTIVSGTPRIDFGRYPNIPLSPGSAGTNFGSYCDGYVFGPTYTLGDPSDPCGANGGIPGDWYDADGTTDNVDPNNIHPPVLAQPSNMTVDEGAVANQTLTATDPDGDALAFVAVSVPTSFTVVSTVNPGLGTGTGNIHLFPGLNSAGTYSATVRATDGTVSDDKSFSITVNNVDRPVTLAGIANMLVTAAETADQPIGAFDEDGDAITFSSTGPPFMTVTLDPQAAEWRRGNIHLAPPLGTSGTFDASIQAAANGATLTRNFTITVVPPTPPQPEDPPSLSPIGDMEVVEGATANQEITAVDSDGDAISFTSSGPAFMTVIPSTQMCNERKATIHLAPSVGQSGTYSASVSATANCAGDSETFAITVTGAAQQQAPLEANVFLTGGNRVIRLSSARKSWCAELEPVASGFQVSDVVPSSITATFGGKSIHAIEVKRIAGDHGVPRLAGYFGRSDLRTLFANLPSGSQTVALIIGGDLAQQRSFKASASVPVEKSGAFGKATPNPSNPSTTITFELRQTGQVRLRIYDVAGRLVNTLADRVMGLGPQEVVWDGVRRDGSRASSGVYYYVLETPERVVKDRLVIAK